MRERASDAVKQKIGSARLLKDECCAHGVPALACTFQCCRERKAVNKMQDRGQFYQSRKRALRSMQQAGPLCRKTWPSLSSASGALIITGRSFRVWRFRNQHFLCYLGGVGALKPPCGLWLSPRVFVGCLWRFMYSEDTFGTSLSSSSGQGSADFDISGMISLNPKP